MPKKGQASVTVKIPVLDVIMVNQLRPKINIQLISQINIRKKRSSKPIRGHKHGSVSTYKKYGCRCRPCKDAVNAYQRKVRARINAELAALREVAQLGQSA